MPTVELTFKSSDVLDQLIDQVEPGELEEVRKVCSRFLEYSEYITVKIQTDWPYTATVDPVE